MFSFGQCIYTGDEKSIKAQERAQAARGNLWYSQLLQVFCTLADAETESPSSTRGIRFLGGIVAAYGSSSYLRSGVAMYIVAIAPPGPRVGRETGSYEIRYRRNVIETMRRALIPPRHNVPVLRVPLRSCNQSNAAISYNCVIPESEIKFD